MASAKEVLFEPIPAIKVEERFRNEDSATKTAVFTIELFFGVCCNFDSGNEKSGVRISLHKSKCS